MEEIKNLMELYKSMEEAINYLKANTDKIDELRNSLEEKYNEKNLLADEAIVKINSVVEESMLQAEHISDNLQALLSKILPKYEKVVSELKKKTEAAEAATEMLNAVLDKYEIMSSTSQYAPPLAIRKSDKKISAKEIDYDEVLTAQELYDKYYGKLEGLFIVKADNWKGDYCLCIEEFNVKNGDVVSVKGQQFYNGNYWKDVEYDADKYMYTMYKSSNMDAIEMFYSYDEEI